MKTDLGPRGFTLLETLVALVITVAAGLILANAWSGNYQRVRKTTLKNNVAQLLERKIVEIETKNMDKKISEISPEEGNFGSDFPQYRWSFTTQPFEMPDMAAVLSSQKDGVDQTLLTVLKKMQELFNKSILEGTVTVYANFGGKETSYSITTYFVDYDTEISLGGFGP